MSGSDQPETQPSGSTALKTETDGLDRRTRRRMERHAFDLCIPFLEFAYAAGLRVEPWTHGPRRDSELKRRIHALEDPALMEIVASGTDHHVVDSGAVATHLEAFETLGA